MGCRIIEGIKDGREECAVLFCSTTEWAFGPVMSSFDEADRFTSFCEANGGDPRRFSDADLLKLWGAFSEIEKKRNLPDEGVEEQTAGALVNAAGMAISGDCH